MDPDQTIKTPFIERFGLSLIIFIFIVKGIFFSLLLPFFQGPDEQIHFAQMEQWAEPKEKNWPIRFEKDHLLLTTDIRTYHLSEEVILSSHYTQFDEVKFQKENTQFFTKTADGVNEQTITENTWKKYIDVYPSSLSATWSLYYFFGSKIEKVLNSTDVLFRLFSLRLFSLAIGSCVVLLSYLTARKIGLSQVSSLFFTVIISFQPMLSQTSSIINYDILIIFSFSLFLYFGVSILRDGMDWKKASLLILAALLGILSKGPGVVLAAALYPLFSWSLYQKLQFTRKKFFLIFMVTTIFIVGIFSLIIPKSYFVEITNLSASSKFDSSLSSLKKYLGESLGAGEFKDTTLSYWGQFGWLDNSVPDWTFYIILFVSSIGFVGGLVYIFSKKDIGYLPERKYIIFFLGMIFALQLAIRFYDWRIFDEKGLIVIGQPGRYFLPNIIGHFAVLVTGLGFWFKRKSQALLLRILAILMILLQIGALINVILPRYYL